MAKKKEMFDKKKIILSIINAGIAGTLVFLGALISGNITWEGICVAFVASLIVFMTKQKEFWSRLSNNKKGTFKYFEFF